MPDNYLKKELYELVRTDEKNFGLANVQGIVHKHLERVWVESELGEGVNFYFKIHKNKEGKSCIIANQSCL